MNENTNCWVNMKSKYKPLQEYLSDVRRRGSNEVTLSFAELEKVLNSRLPGSAYRYPAWWANQSDLSNRPQVRAWMSTGFEVAAVHRDKGSGWVRFARSRNPMDCRLGTPESPVERSHPVRPRKEPVKAGKNTKPFIPRKEAIYLVSCVAGKRDKPSMTKDLYISAWFLKAKSYVEQRHAKWFILSAEYGLVDPDQKIAPYEKTLNTMGIAGRREWAARVIEQMDKELPDTRRVVVFAGQRYREFLMDYLEQSFEDVVVPLSQLRIGEQLSWFDQGD